MSLFCHQIAERSYFLFGEQLPLCARCAGIVLGLAFGLTLTLIGRRQTWERYWRFVVIAVLMNGVIKLHPALDSNLVRLLAGIALGAGCSVFPAATRLKTNVLTSPKVTD